MLLEILGVGAILMIGSYLKDRFGCKNSLSYAQETKLPYKTIRDIYHLNKGRWRYSKVLAPGYHTISGFSRVLLYNTNENGEWPDLLNASGGHKERKGIVRVNVSFPTWVLIKFCRVFRNVPTKGTEMVLESAQKDIDKLKLLADKELEEANRRMLEVRESLKKQQEEKEKDKEGCGLVL